MKVLILITLVAMATMTNAVFSCPQFWDLFNGSCYLYLGDRVTWTAAEARCNEFFTTKGNGHLTSVLSKEENRFVYELFRSAAGVDDIADWVYDRNNRNPVYGVWIGLHQAVANGPWVNTDGSAQGSFEKWKSNEPNNDYYQGEQAEDCVHIWRLNDASDILQEWNDMYCGEVMSFVCEMPADGAACE